MGGVRVRETMVFLVAILRVFLGVATIQSNRGAPRLCVLELILRKPRYPTVPPLASARVPAFWPHQVRSSSQSWVGNRAVTGYKNCNALFSFKITSSSNSYISLGVCTSEGGGDYRTSCVPCCASPGHGDAHAGRWGGGGRFSNGPACGVHMRAGVHIACTECTGECQCESEGVFVCVRVLGVVPRKRAGTTGLCAAAVISTQTARAWAPGPPARLTFNS